MEDAGAFVARLSAHFMRGDSDSLLTASQSDGVFGSDTQTGSNRNGRRSPNVAHGASATVGVRVGGELAIELAEQRHAIDEPQFRSG